MFPWPPRQSLARYTLLMPGCLRPFSTAALFLVVLLHPGLLTAQPTWQAGTLVSVEKKVESTPRTYLWDVVVTSTDVITYRLQVRVGNSTYTSDYTPEIQPSELPSGWKPGVRLDVKVEKSRMFIRTTYGELTSYIRDRG